MKDLHSHFLPGIDDGSRNIEETYSLLECASNAGVKDIVFTPHYIVNSKYDSSRSKNIRPFNKIKKYAKETYDINLYLGNEVYFCENVVELLKKKTISSINGSKYVLIEIPMHSKVNETENVFYEMLANGYVPILAHPERYSYYYNNMDFFIKLHNMGVLFQINFPSLVGKYGLKAKIMAIKLLKKDLVDFVGSDIHHIDNNKYECVDKALKILKKHLTKERYLDVVDNNFDNVINNKDIN